MKKKTTKMIGIILPISLNNYLHIQLFF